MNLLFYFIVQFFVNSGGISVINIGVFIMILLYLGTLKYFAGNEPQGCKDNLANSQLDK